MTLDLLGTCVPSPGLSRQGKPAGRRPLSLTQGTSELQGKITWALRPQPYRRHPVKKPSKDTCHPSTFNGPHLPTHLRVWEPPRALVIPVNLLSPPGSNTGEAPHKTHCLAPGIRRKSSGGTILSSRPLGGQEKWLAHCLDS